MTERQVLSCHRTQLDTAENAGTAAAFLQVFPAMSRSTSGDVPAGFGSYCGVTNTMIRSSVMSSMA